MYFVTGSFQQIIHLEFLYLEGAGWSGAGRDWTGREAGWGAGWGWAGRGASWGTGKGAGLGAGLGAGKGVGKGAGKGVSWGLTWRGKNFWFVILLIHKNWICWNSLIRF